MVVPKVRQAKVGMRGPVKPTRRLMIHLPTTPLQTVLLLLMAEPAAVLELSGGGSLSAWRWRAESGVGPVAICRTSRCG